MWDLLCWTCNKYLNNTLHWKLVFLSIFILLITTNTLPAISLDTNPGFVALSYTSQKITYGWIIAGSGGVTFMCSLRFLLTLTLLWLPRIPLHNPQLFTANVCSILPHDRLLTGVLGRPSVLWLSIRPLSLSLPLSFSLIRFHLSREAPILGGLNLFNRKYSYSTVMRTWISSHMSSEACYPKYRVFSFINERWYCGWETPFSRELAFLKAKETHEITQ